MINVILNQTVYSGNFFIMSHTKDTQGLQIFIKIDLKCSTYGSDHKTEILRLIEFIVNFWELVEVGKIGVFGKNSYMIVGKSC
jgi:hypothetical protein